MQVCLTLSLCRGTLNTRGNAVEYSSFLNPGANVKELNGVAGFVRNRMRYRRLGGSSGFLQTQLHKPLTATVQRVDTDPVPHCDSSAKQYLQEAIRLRSRHGFDLAYLGTEVECSCPCAHHHDRWWIIER